MHLIRTEIRWASLLLAYCSFVYVLTAFNENPSYFRSLIDWYEIGDTWLWLQLCISILLGIAAIVPWRSLLHIGLSLSAFAWLALWTTLRPDLESSPGAYLFPAYGLTAFALLIDDVLWRKRRC